LRIGASDRKRAILDLVEHSLARRDRRLVGAGRHADVGRGPADVSVWLRTRGGRIVEPRQGRALGQPIGAARGRIFDQPMVGHAYARGQLDTVEVASIWRQLVLDIGSAKADLRPPCAEGEPPGLARLHRHRQAVDAVIEPLIVPLQTGTREVDRQQFEVEVQQPQVQLVDRRPRLVH
jgi:hypothetical protein